MNNDLAELKFGNGLIRNIDKDRGRVSNTDRVRGCACLWTACRRSLSTKAKWSDDPDVQAIFFIVPMPWTIFGYLYYQIGGRLPRSRVTLFFFIRKYTAQT